MATNGVRCSYEEIIDLHTESDRVTAIGIHTPTGAYPHKMFKGFFDMYKKYKYLGCSIKFVPIAKLPADPLQVSYEAGDTTIDPRDLANPIMFHGCHGDDLGTILNKLYGDDNGISDSIVGLEYQNGDGQQALYDSLERLYYKALTDRTWKKAGSQRGFVKSGLRPLVYSLATNHQIMPSFGIPDGGNNLDEFGGSPTNDYEFDFATTPNSMENKVRVDTQLFTPRLTGLGWMDTRNVLTLDAGVVYGEDIPESSDPMQNLKAFVNKGFVNQINYAYLPKLFMGVILLSPSYKVEQYYRCIIKHFFAFKQFRGISFRPEVVDVPTYWDKNDDLFGGLEDGHYNDIPIDSSGSGGGGDDPTITVTDANLRVINDSAVDTGSLICMIKYPGTANFVNYHSFGVVRSGTSSVYGVTNLPVGSVLVLVTAGASVSSSLMITVVSGSQTANTYTWEKSASNQWAVYHGSLSETSAVKKELVWHEL